MDLLFRLTYNPFVWKHSARYVYPMQTRQLKIDDVVFLNVGYQEDPPMDVPLEAADEVHRASIQLYHRTATGAKLAGKRVLEVGCGHGGGASYITRYLHPASYTGLDLNPRGIAFCRRNHSLPGLDFVVGDAQDLPFAAESLDAVINVESSHCYPDFAGFLREVARVLVPGGVFLYTDLRNRSHLTSWESDLAAAPLVLHSQRDINSEVVRGLDLLWSSAQMREQFDRQVPRVLRRLTRGVAGAPGPGLHHALQTGDMCYRMFVMRKD